MGHFHTFLRPGSLHFVSMVLEPDFHLGWSQADQTGEMLPLRGWQIPLLPKPALEFVSLCLGKEHPPFALLTGVAAVARSFLVVVRRLVRWRFRRFADESWEFADRPCTGSKKKKGKGKKIHLIPHQIKCSLIVNRKVCIAYVTFICIYFQLYKRTNICQRTLN